MNKVKIIDKIIPTEDLKDINRIYIGNDYCEKNLNKSKIISFIEYYKNQKAITLLLPFMTNFGIKLLADILGEGVVSELENFEIVFNDWGTFYYLRKYYPIINLVVGRLLTKQRKDPRIDNTLKKQDTPVDVFDVLVDYQDKTKTMRKYQEIPNYLIDLYYRHSLETPDIINFLLENNVHRIEIDNLVWKMISEIPAEIKVSLYYPYILMSVTRYCVLLHGKYNNVCNKDCLENKIINLEEGFCVKGNAVYFKNEQMPAGIDLITTNIDRIIYQTL